jgi:HD-GYP domain-containing protein (c-di-GMP phosphodiesterase class II)
VKGGGLYPSDKAKDAEFLDHIWELAVARTESKDQNYLAVEIHQLISDQEVPFGLYLRDRKGGKNSSAYRVSWAQGEVISGVRMNQLLERGIDRVYFRSGDLGKVLAYLESNLTLMVQDESLPISQRAKYLVNIIYLWLQCFFTQWRVEGVSQLPAGLKYLDDMLGVIRQDRDYRIWLLEMYRGDHNLFSHSLNCSLLSMGFGTYLGWGVKNICDLSRAALLHDIGLTLVPLTILNKPGALTSEEMEAVKKHTRRGYYLLQTFFPFSRDTLLAVLQHHENGDGSGYPEGLNLPMIHPMARMLRIIDSYNALTSPRSWRPAYKPEKALWILRQEWQESGIFDASLLMEFINFLSG